VAMARSGSFRDEKNPSLIGLQGGLGRGPPSDEGDWKSNVGLVWIVHQGGLLSWCSSHPVRGH
jgi:hypothetical protein